MEVRLWTLALMKVYAASMSCSSCPETEIKYQKGSNDEVSEGLKGAGSIKKKQLLCTNICPQLLVTNATYADTAKS